MFRLLSLLLLAQLAAPAQERPSRPDTPPVEVLDAEVNTYATRPRVVPDRSLPDPPPGPISSADDIPGSGEARRKAMPSIANRSSELHGVDGRGRRAAAGGGSSQTYRYDYRARLKNVGSKKVTSVLWEYRATGPSDTPVNSRRLILCSEALKPGESRRLHAWSPMPPLNVVSADAAGGGPLKAEVVVNRVEYADGSAWQRDGWEHGDLKNGSPVGSGRPLRAGECVVW